MIDNEYYYENYYEWFIPKFEIYLNSYVDAAKDYANNTPMERISAGWHLEKLWINYQKANEYNPPHDHTGDLSFVIYFTGARRNCEGKMKKQNTNIIM